MNPLFGILIICTLGANIYLARKKNRSVFVWIFLGLILHIFSTIVLLIIKPRPQGQPNRAPLAVCLILLSVVWIYTENQFYAKNQATKIINALEAYRKDQNVYPTALEELVPKYLNKIPSPKLIGAEWKNKFTYDRGFEFLMGWQKGRTDDPQKYCLTYPIFSFFRTTYVPSKNICINFD